MKTVRSLWEKYLMREWSGKTAADKKLQQKEQALRSM